MPDRTYFDYCATTPVHPQVLEAMLPCLQDAYGNPSSLHAHGRAAAEILNQARQKIADAIGADPHEIIFTSGATEANNLALQGPLRAAGDEKTHLITSAIEHHAVLHTAEALTSQGYEISVVPVDHVGNVDPESVRAAIRPTTALISIMFVNNEVGSLQPVDDIARIAHANGVHFHTDAVQAVGMYPVDVHASGIDLLSLSAHKVYGPKGVGALYIRDGIDLLPILYGGPQERQLRAGTENLPGIVGLGAAMHLVRKERDQEANRLHRLRQQLINRIQSEIPNANVNGHPDRAAPHILSVSFPGADAEMMLFRLDQHGFSASMGSACNAESVEPSHVLQALGLPNGHIHGTLRFSLGYPTLSDDIDRLISILPAIAEECTV